MPDTIEPQTARPTTPVTDDGVQHLRGLSRLRLLWIVNTRVSESAISELQASLPECRVRRHEHGDGETRQDVPQRESSVLRGEDPA